MQANLEVVQALLKVNIPVIAPKHHTEWQVSLTDNPGFGEHHEVVTAEAGRSLQISAAYIVLVRMEDIGDTEIISTFKKIARYDKGVKLLYFGACTQVISWPLFNS